jgi:protein-tyrosine phosphatase
LIVHSAEGLSRRLLEEYADANSVNLRDFGGYRTASGAALKQGRLFRSGQLELVDDRFTSVLARLGISTVIDLRAGSERLSPSGPAFSGYSGSVQAATADDEPVPHDLSHFLGAASPAEVVERMRVIYRMLPSSVRFRQSMGNFVRAAFRAEGGTLIHCFAGKDRTGLAVALLHVALGVHRDDVLHDYLLTNKMGTARVETAIEWLLASRDVTAPDWLLREIMEVRAEYLEAGLEEVAATGASPAKYLASAADMTTLEFEIGSNCLVC